MRATAIVAFGVAVALVSPAATAQPGRAAPSQILFESRPRGGDGDGKDAVLARLREALRAQQVVVDPRAIAELPNEILPLTGAWDEELTLAALTAQLDSGVRAYLRGQFKPAAAQLEAGLALARRNPALVVRDATSPRWLTQALVSLALTKQRLRDRAGARAAMAEQVRSFPELPVTLADYGSRGEALYLEVRGELETGPRGSLLIDVSDPDARIYVNERGRGRGGAYAADVLPGAYRVLVVVGAESRLYRVTVHANEQTRLQIDWSEDARYRVSPRWAGMEPVERYAGRGSGGDGGRGRDGDGGEQARQRLGRRLAFSDAIVVGIGEERGERWIWGAVYERGSGRRLRRGELRGDELLRFAEFLRSGRYARSFRAPSALFPLARRAAAETGEPRAASGWPRRREAREQGREDARDRGREDARAQASEGEREESRRGSREEALDGEGARGGEAERRAARAQRPRAANDRWNGIAAIAFAGIGLAGVAGGTYHALEFTKRSCPPCEGDRSPAWAIAMIGGGVVSLGVATFFAVEHHAVARRSARDRGPRPRRLEPSTEGASARGEEPEARASFVEEQAPRRRTMFAIRAVPHGTVAVVGWQF